MVILNRWVEGGRDFDLLRAFIAIFPSLEAQKTVAADSDLIRETTYSQLRALRKLELWGHAPFLRGFLGCWRSHMHRFLAVLATVTCRLHGRYRVPGLRKVETTGLWGLRCVGKGT